MPDDTNPAAPAPTVAPVVIEQQGQVAVPKWTVSVIGSLFMALLLASGGWVLRTWDAPERIAGLEAEVDGLQAARAEEKLKAQEKLSKIQQDLALMQKDVESINTSMAYISSRLTP